jgi:hypothetical protein
MARPAAVQVVCPAAVIELLPGELSEIQAMAVIDDHILGLQEPATGSLPSLAELPVFRRRERKALVEAAHRPKVVHQRRVVVAHRLLARFEQTREFWWQETPYVHTPEDVVSLIQRQCGCRWIAIEIGLDDVTTSERLLRLALYGPEFEHVASFPVSTPAAVRVELYRFRPPLEPARPVDLVFPSFSNRVFRGIQPVASRR